MVELQSQISFEHMLAHMFPGFFAAITVFMILDLMSSLDISAYVFKDLNALLGFFGAILLGGTILGIIIDGIHHKIIEQMYFEEYMMEGKGDIKSERIIEHFRKQHCVNCEKNKKNIKYNKQLILLKPEVNRSSEECEFNFDLPYTLMKIFYLFDVAQLDKYIEIFEYHRKEIYHYYEFFANTFIAMIPFTFVAPIYLMEEIRIYWWQASLLAVILALTEICCLYLGLLAYKRYVAALYFSFCRCIEKKWDPYI